jgi:hypothetical protein
MIEAEIGDAISLACGRTSPSAYLKVSEPCLYQTPLVMWR